MLIALCVYVVYHKLYDKNDVSASMRLWNFKQCLTIAFIQNDVHNENNCVWGGSGKSILSEKNEWVLEKKKKENLMVGMASTACLPPASRTHGRIYIHKMRNKARENGEFICCAPSSLVVCDAILVNEWIEWLAGWLAGGFSAYEYVIVWVFIMYILHSENNEQLFESTACQVYHTHFSHTHPQLLFI